MDLKFINDVEILSSGKKPYKYPYIQLLFWALLNNLHEMAIFLWGFGEAGLAKAILGAEINKALSKQAGTMNVSAEMETSFMKNSK